MNDAPALDRRALDGLLDSVGGDRAFLVELIDTFLEDAPQQLEAIRRAIETGDAETLRRSAHTLKSNSLSFGASSLAGQARELEEIGRSGQPRTAKQHVAALASEYERVQQALAAERVVS